MLLLLWALPAAAQAAGERHVAMRLVAESDTPAPGSRVALAIVSEPDAGWHGYWRNPGAVGTQPRLAWRLPAGVTLGEIRYPVPERLLVAGLMNYVYERPWALLTELAVPAGLAKGTALPVRLSIQYLVCTREICVPERAELATELTVGDGAVTPGRRAAFDGWRRALPRPMGAQAVFEGGEAFRLRVPFPADAPLGDAYFFAGTEGAIDYAAPQTIVRDGDAIVVATKGAGKPATVEGVLATGEGQGFAIRAVPGAVAMPLPPVAFDWRLALLAFGGALLGGLLLNVMPCVFPILSLKALSLARSGESDAKARGEGVAYTAGAVATCMALGGVLLAIRAAGVSAGWAFQLTDPRVVLLLLLLTGAIALNLAGLFELPTPQLGARGGRGGAFATGALAAFVATPCTGPFMGAALGSALVLPPLAAMAVFAGLGLGLALPFLLLGFVPALRRRLPKPGAWMDAFRKGLSVPMFLTALALAWLLGRQAGVDGMAIGLAALLLAALGLWWTGRRQARGRDRAWWPALAALAVACGGAALVTRAAPAARATIAGTEAFSEARLAALRAEGRPVFAYFTADWCLTCKVNERAAIETRAVADAFGRGKVATLVGDWTDGDPALGRFIEAHNRAGVPLYLWYAPGAKEPQVLPQVLTPGTLTALVPQ
ncbi:protein-disulfide reductase DsbD family protein [Sphingomonas silueang]|uniref:protein-disulfide reductase DsbD family protein n=1 Tax=Sphingomonas silueang TaxID=3156617 RepID=UPI0032B393A4